MILLSVLKVGRVTKKVQCSYFDFKHLEKQGSVSFHIHHKIPTLVSKPIELIENILGRQIIAHNKENYLINPQ